MNGNQKSKTEDSKIMKIIKESCHLQNSKPEDWQKYGPEVIIYLYV